MKRHHWIRSAQMIRGVVETARKEGALALDTEFLRETTFFPKIALVQLATREEVWLLDPLEIKKPDIDPLLDLLQETSVLKILHASFADQEVLYWTYGILAQPVLDTSIAAGLTGYGDNVGLGKLVNDCLGVRLPKGRARAKWLERPLSRELEEYAAEDVRHLNPLSEKLRQELDRLGRKEWALFEATPHKEDFDPAPERIAERMGRTPHLSDESYSILVELVLWREARVRKANLPRAWVAANETLLSLARVVPKSIQDLKSLRGLGRGEVEREGNKILEAVERGYEKKHKRPIAEWSDTSVDPSMVSFLMTYVNLLSEGARIAPRYLLTSASATRLMHLIQNPKEDWTQCNVMSPYAQKLIGKDISALLNGERGLVFRHNRLEVADLASPTR